MIRTQIQITDQQAKQLKHLSVQENKSVAELIRQSIDTFLNRQIFVSDQEKQQKLLSVAGKFHTGLSDLAEEHDRYLDEAFGA